jgi:hypothetical protein
MKYRIEVEEIIKRINGYVIEVNNEEEAEELLSDIESRINRSSCSDDIEGIIEDAGYEVIEYYEGAEDYECELL